jgi:hypothetical protein
MRILLLCLRGRLENLCAEWHLYDRENACGAVIVALLIYCKCLRPTPHANNIVIAIKRKGGSHDGRSDDCKGG